MPKVIRLQNPRALASKEFRTFLNRSVRRGSLLSSDALIQGLPSRLSDPNFVALVGVEDGAFKGLVLFTLPANVWQTSPFILHFYNGGKAALRDALIKATVDFIVQAGYTSFISVNLTGKSSDTLAKTFRKAGKGKVIGEMMEFTVG